MADNRNSGNIRPGFVFLLFVFFFSIYSLTLEGLPTGGDAWGMFLVTNSLVEKGSIYLAKTDRVVLREGRGGKFVSKYGIGQSLAEIPAYLVARFFAARDTTSQPTSLLYFITSFTSPLISAGLCVLFFLMCLRLGFDNKVSLALTALLGLGSLVWPHSKTLFSEPLQAFCLAACFYALMLWRGAGGARRALAAGFFLGLAVATKPFLILSAPPAVFYFLGGLGSRPRGENRAAAAAALFFAALSFWIGAALCYNWLRFGNIFEFGYLGGADRDGVHGFNMPLLVGLHGLLFSSGKGLMFFAPAVFLLIFAWRPFAKRHPAEAWTIAATFILMLFSYAKWNAWHGDFSWGPRFLLPAVPLLLLPLGVLFEPDGFWRRASGKAAIAAVFLVSFFVQVLGVAVNYNENFLITDRSAPVNSYFSPSRVELRDNLLSEHYVPEFSQLAGHYWLLKHTLLHRNLPENEAAELMRSDFPWKGLLPYAAPRGATSGLGFDAWWFHFLRFYPRTVFWVYPLALFFGIMLIISTAELATATVKMKG